MKNDKIFTPSIIVSQMLDAIKYNYDNLNKTIFEPSFGDGNILIEIVSRILDYANTPNDAYLLLNNVHGCELDPILYQKCIERLNIVLKRYAMRYGWGREFTYDWSHLKCCNALDYPDIKFDYIIGNPPYIRIHDLDKDTRDKLSHFELSSGMTDLYIAFFELGINHLKRDGELIYITPNSFIKNTSQRRFRKFISTYIKSIKDFAAFPVFKDISTYTCITHIKLNHHGLCTYTKMKDFTTSAFSINGDIANKSEWLFLNENDSAFMEKINTRRKRLCDICDIRYGVATNADKVFIDPIGLESKIMRPAIKASTLDNHTILFPYNIDGSSLSLDKLKECPVAYKYLSDNRFILDKRDIDNNTPWYAYARSQGLHNIHYPKFVLKHILSPDAKLCEFREVSAETIVYSGMFIIPNDNISYDTVRNVLSSEEFCRYLKINGKDLANGYKSVNTKIVKQFLIEN